MRRAAAALALLVAVTLPGMLRAGEDHERVKELKEAGEVMALEAILAKAQAQHPGRVIGTELEHEGGRYVYEVELVDPQGVVWELRFDGKSGALIETQPDH